jgi:internalin A
MAVPIRIHSCSLLLAVAVGLLLSAACDEPGQPSTTAPSAAASAPAPARASASSVARARKPPKRQRKRAEDCPKGPNLVFDDPAVEQAVRFKLQKPTGSISRADLGRLRSLNLSQVQVDELDICLFPHMKALRELFLGRGQLDDLSPIAELVHLESLRASMNRVRDLAPLAKLTKMDRLDLGLTQVADLTPLSGMTELTELQLDDTPVEDLKPLGPLKKLERLSVQRTRVKDFSPLAGLKSLKFLYVSGCPGEYDAMSQLGKLTQSGLRIIAQ